jgi:hypothetical protein
MKYKVGDKVRVKQDLEIGKKYGCADFTNDMQMYIGKIVTIARVLWVSDGSGDFGYDIVEDKGFYIWTHEMLESLAEESKAPSVTKRINDKHNILNGLLQTDGSVDGEKLMKKLEESQVQANGVVMSDRPQRPTESASTPASTERKEKFKEGDKLQFVKEYKFPRGGTVLKGSIWEVAIVNTEIYTLLYVGGENSISGKCGYNINLPLEVLTSHCVRVFGEVPEKESKVGNDYYEKSAMQPLEVMQRIMTPEQFKGFLLGNCIKYRMRCDNKGQHDSDLYKARQYAYWLELVRQGKTINPSVDVVPEGYEFKVV